MKIDSAIKVFSEKYDRDAIVSIDAISNDYGLKISDSSIKAFNLKESFNIFNQYLKGYASYKIDNVNKTDAYPQTAIRESVKKFIDTQIFKETHIKYGELPEFVTGYINGITSLIETVNDIKRNMTDGNVIVEDIGDVNEFTDIFMDKLNESFDASMDRILWASGYNGRKKLSTPSQDKPKAPILL